MQYDGITSSECIDIYKILGRDVVEVIRSLGYTKLTEVQIKALPLIGKCRNVLIVAPTGSGKTEAALFPIFSSIYYNGLRPIAALYITPLRALNRDIFRRMFRVCEKLGITIDIRHGDTPYSGRKKIERDPPQILITTPETFSYILVNKKLKKYLRNVNWLVIDEFHELINSKRGTQLLINISRLEYLRGKSARKIALSASIGDIDEAASVLSTLATNVCKVIISKVRDVDIRVYSTASTDLSSKSSSGYVGDKVSIIADLINKHKKILIFVNTRDEAEWLGARLSSLGIDVRVHHGSLSKEERELTEYLLRQGGVKAVVATSSLELGIDVGDIDLVIQVSSPKQAIKLLQRVGRSLHGISNVARGVVVTDNTTDDILESLVLARRVKSGQLEGLEIYRNSLDVLAHAIVGMSLEYESLDVNKVYNIITKVPIYRDLSFDYLEKLVEFLNDHGLIRVVNGKIEATGKGKLYYLRTTMIVDTSKYTVVNLVDGSKIGDLDEDFIAINVEQGKSVVLGGRIWKVISIDDESKKVYVEPMSGEEALIPSWSGETIPVSYRVAREVCRLRYLIGMGFVPKYYRGMVNERDISIVENIIKNHISKRYTIPHDSNAVIEIVRSKRPLLILHTCLGTKGNRGLGILFSYLIGKYLGVQPLMKVDPYRIIIEVPINISDDFIKKIINKVFNDLTNDDVANTIRRALKSTRLYELVIARILNRLGIVNTDMPRNLIKTLVRRYSEDFIVSTEAINEIFTKYIDIKALKHFIDILKKGHIKFYISDEPSPLGSEGLKLTIYYDRVKSSSMPKNIIAELMRRRLLSKEVTLICMSCGYYWKSKISELPDRVQCPKCGLSLIALNSNLGDNERIRSIVLKGKKAGFRYKFVLDEEEKKIFEKLIDMAKLVLSYGRRAIIALSCRGVGVATAKVALSVFNEDEFYLKLYELERNYLRTRKYWH